MGGCTLRWLIWTVTASVFADQHWVEPFYAIVMNMELDFEHDFVLLSCI